MAAGPWKRIAIFNQNRNFFGTQVLQIPFLQQLRVAFPDAKLQVFTSNSLSQLFGELHLVDEVCHIADVRQQLRVIRRLDADLIFSFRQHSDLLNFGLGLNRHRTTIGFASPVTRLCFTHTIKKDTSRYRARHYLDFLHPLGIDTHSAFAHVAVLADAGAPRKAPGERWVFFMPGAGRPFKLWGAPNFVELASRLSALAPGVRFRVVVGHDERELGRNIADRCTGALDCARTVPELLGLLLQADLVVAHDCGPSHLSHLCGAPHVALFSNEKYDASAVIAEWFLPRANAHALVGPTGASITALPVEDVFGACRDILSRSEGASAQAGGLCRESN